MPARSGKESTLSNTSSLSRLLLPAAAAIPAGVAIPPPGTYTLIAEAAGFNWSKDVMAVAGTPLAATGIGTLAGTVLRLQPS